jgi:hypothetical protein
LVRATSSRDLAMILVGDFGFIMLSFTAKTFLSWITLAGANSSWGDSF